MTYHRHEISSCELVNGCSFSMGPGLRLVPGVPHLSIVGASFGPLGSVSLNLIGGTVVQVFQRLVAHLVHSEGTVSGVVAWPVWLFEVARAHVASSGWWSWSASLITLGLLVSVLAVVFVAPSLRIPLLVPRWWSSLWSISAVHWGRASTIVVLGRVTRSLKLD